MHVHGVVFGLASTTLWAPQQMAPYEALYKLGQENEI
jgi:hypothetical protein